MENKKIKKSMATTKKQEKHIEKKKNREKSKMTKKTQKIKKQIDV